MDIVTNIYEGFCRADQAEQHRGYLGMSSIGKPCEREAWHSWRQTTGGIMPGSVLALLEQGKHVEQIICEGLRHAGYQLTHAWPDEQIGFSDMGGFFRGHPDGGILVPDRGWGVLETKGACATKMKKMVKNGIAATYPGYFGQVILYMGYWGMQFALIIVMSRSDGSMYQEYIDFDEAKFQALRARAARVLTAKASWMVEGPAEEEAKKTSETCQMCLYRTQCYDGAEHIQTIKTCRSCAWFQMSPAFEPSCSNPKHAFPLKALDKNCGDWEYVDQWNPEQVPF
jgi:hypothetical protein